MKRYFMILLLALTGMLGAKGQVITITSPHNGDLVSQNDNTITVSVTGGMPTGQCIVIFVQDPNKNWWPYMNAVSNNSRTVWTANPIKYGENVDHNKQFAIQAVLMPNRVQTKGLNLPINNDGGSISLLNYGAFIRGLSTKEYSSIVNVTR